MENTVPTSSVAATPACPTCHMQVRPTDFFCSNCGANLHPRPLPTDIASQVVLYIKCVVLLPFGIIWGFRYLREKDAASRRIGIIAIAITVLVLWMVVASVLRITNAVNTELNKQLEGFGGL